jgi:fatty acid desaturase
LLLCYRNRTAPKKVTDADVSSGARVKGEHFGMKPQYWYISGQAYDFSKFNHPGGVWAKNLGKGRECLSLINAYHLNMPDEKIFAKYKVDGEQARELFPPVRKFSYKQDGFFNTVKREAAQYFKEKNMSHKAPWFNFAMFFINIFMMVAGMYAMVNYESYIGALVHGVFRAILVVQATHGASHFAFSHWPAINRWAYRTGTVLIGLWSPAVWDVQHVVSHHNFTNEWAFDSDSAFPLKSIFENQRRFWFHKYQHIYMWVVYAFTIPLVMLNSIRDTITKKQVLYKLRFHNKNDEMEAYICQVLSIVYVLLPFLLMPFWSALPVALVSNITSSLFFSLQFVVNHEVDSIVHTNIDDKYDADGKIDWGIYQCTQSLTFAPHSPLATFLAGGLNNQIEHHLFPGVHFSHYPSLVPIIKRVAKKFDVEYNYRDTLVEAVQAHYELLKNPPKSNRT